MYIYICFLFIHNNMLFTLPSLSFLIRWSYLAYFSSSFFNYTAFHHFQYMSAVTGYPLSLLLCNFKSSESSSMCAQGPRPGLSVIHLPVSTPAPQPWPPVGVSINLWQLGPLCFCQSASHSEGSLFQRKGLQRKELPEALPSWETG